MKEIEFYAGDNIDNAWKMLLRESANCGDTCFGLFNGKEIRSTDTLDEAEEHVFGYPKSKEVVKREILDYE